MSDNMSGTWPEQDAVEKWFKDYSAELKKSVTEYRLEHQRKLTAIEKKVDELIASAGQRELYYRNCDLPIMAQKESQHIKYLKQISDIFKKTYEILESQEE